MSLTKHPPLNQIDSAETLSKGGYIWQYKGVDIDLGSVYPDIKWNNLKEYRSNICEIAFLAGHDKATSDGGEYQFRDLLIDKPYFYIIDFAYASENIFLRRIKEGDI